MDPILGQIILWPVPWVPYGWALCDGSTLSINQNQALFSLLGTYYGGDGVTNFRLPDLRNKFPMGTDVMNQVAMQGGATSANLSGATGVGSVTIGLDNLPPHSHEATFTPGAATTASVSVPADATGASSNNSPGPTTVLGNISAGTLAARVYSTDAATTTLKPFDVAVPASGGSVAVASAGGGQPLPVQVSLGGNVGTVPPYLTLNFIIALQGVYPSRP
ncbi:phage tail protein [uncultured Massilia sp.]|uniref:phage tail protein n=1 Tax=uncultured Massilia sp. TaxID=169973 RepID=UPI0025E0BB51|nr:tail fiber protein [uncultured Massilia sp.]